MNKDDMVSGVARDVGVPRKVAAQVIDEAFGNIFHALTNGDEVRLAGFGTFKVVKRAGRVGRNPRSGEAVEIPPRCAPVFKPCGALREAVALAGRGDGN